MREFSELSIAIVVSLFALSAVYTARDFFVPASISPQPQSSASQPAIRARTEKAVRSAPMPPAAPVLARQPIHRGCDPRSTFGRPLPYAEPDISEVPCIVGNPEEPLRRRTKGDRFRIGS